MFLYTYLKYKNTIASNTLNATYILIIGFTFVIYFLYTFTKTENKVPSLKLTIYIYIYIINIINSIIFIIDLLTTYMKNNIPGLIYNYSTILFFLIIKLYNYTITFNFL